MSYYPDRVFSAVAIPLWFLCLLGILAIRVADAESAMHLIFQVLSWPYSGLALFGSAALYLIILVVWPRGTGFGESSKRRKGDAQYLINTAKELREEYSRLVSDYPKNEALQNPSIENIVHHAPEGQEDYRVWAWLVRLRSHKADIGAFENGPRWLRWRWLRWYHKRLNLFEYLARNDYASHETKLRDRL